MKAFRSRRVLVDGEGLRPAIVLVKSGKISGVVDYNASIGSDYSLTDVGDKVVMPGVVDSHVHINEPGRTDWEGFTTATKAAAVGGVTTIVDMPLNSLPPTTTLQNLNIKMNAAKGQCWVDVGFWGGVIPGNAGHLVEMTEAGLPGFKCFLIHSGVDEFPCVSKAEALLALGELKKTQARLLFHAECEIGSCGTGDPAAYSTFLESRPPQMELEAIQIVIEVCRATMVPCHIVHLSAASALPLIRSAKSEGLPLTVETCHHYLSLSSDIIPDKATQYKCCPPIRDSGNQELLWDAVIKGDIDLVVSDHSPCTPDLKQPGVKDFMDSWGGISSLQFGLSLFWTQARERGLGFTDVNRLLSTAPASLAGLADRKGRLVVGYDADLVVWAPEETARVREDGIQHKNKITPYIGRDVYGVVHQTIVGGEVVYDRLTGLTSCPTGNLLVPHPLKSQL